MNNHKFTNRGILGNKEVEIAWWLILPIFSLGILGLLGISFTFVYQFSYLILICSITLMFMAITSEAAKKFPLKLF
jgi:hypothetical protein